MPNILEIQTLFQATVRLSQITNLITNFGPEGNETYTVNLFEAIQTELITIKANLSKVSVKKSF